MDNLLTRKQAEDAYNKLGLYEDYQVGRPWWELTDNEMNYYRWLFRLININN
jgi:hypothetical protein